MVVQFNCITIDNVLYYMLKNHPGSANVITDNSGNTVGEARYYPYGETRLTTGTIPTDQLFTGQREMAGLGIYHYGARFYSPTLRRFLSADTIVPNVANPQAFNRYSYVYNNPLRYADPSGNIPIDCWNDPTYCSNTTTLPESPYSSGRTYEPPDDDPCTRNCGDEDDDVTITITRDDLIEIENAADELAVEYQTAGDNWVSGTETVVGIGMLFVDGITCVAAVRAPSVPTVAACGGAIFVTVAGVPVATNLAGMYGGHAHAQAYGTISEYLEDVLINDSAEQFTVTISQSTHTEVILPGGVGPTTTIYTISVDGYSGSTEVYNSFGNDAISSLFGVVP